MKRIDARQAMTELQKQQDDNPSLVVSVKLSNGHFEAQISIPLHSDDEAKKAFVESWLDLISAGLKAGKRTAP